MTYTKIQYFPLEYAYLCQDCNSISNNAGSCPACASTVLMNLATVLDREEAPAQADRGFTYTFPKTIVRLSTKVA
jgi:hypothetical protein